MHAKRLFILLVLPMAGAVCNCGNNTSTTGPAEAGAQDLTNSDGPIVDVPPDAAVCDQLAAAAAAQFESYLQSTSSLACQVDSDCSHLYVQSLKCFAVCGLVMGTADISAVTAATASVCDQYFSAGCTAINVPCIFTYDSCDHGTCATGYGPGGPSGSTDAAVDEGTGEIPIDGGNTSEASIDIDGGACTWPASFTPTGDDNAVGCWAHAIIGTADGGQFSCSASEYALHCTGDIAWPDSGCEVRTMPAPAPSLGCRLLPLPTAFNQDYYCCPCGQGQASLSDASVSMGCPN